MVVEDLKIKLAFLCGTDDSVPVCLVQDSDCTASAAYTLVTRCFGIIDQDRGGGDVIGQDVEWG